MNVIDWNDESALKDAVFKAVKCKRSGKEGGCVGDKVEGMFARVVEIVSAQGGQKSNRYRTSFYATEDDAQDGSEVEATLKEVFTLNALQGHAGFKPVVELEDGSEGEELSGEEEDEASPQLLRGAKKKKGKKKQNDKALKAALRAAGLFKSDALPRMRAAGIETVEEIESLAGAGTGSLPEIARVAKLASVEQAALGKYMSATPGRALGDAYLADDSGEDGEDGSSDDEERPAKKGKAVPAPKGKSHEEKGEQRALLAILLEHVPKAERNAVAHDVLEGLCDGLGKAPTAREKKNVMASAEAKLRAMEFTKDQLRPDPPGGADEVSARVTEICTAWEKPAARSVRGGVASALGDGELATVASGQQEPGLATALATLLAEPGMLAAVQLIMSEEDTAKAVKMMAKMAGDKSTGPSFSVLAHKGGELKLPSGVRQSSDALRLVHSVGRLKQRWTEWVAESLRVGAHLPGGADAIAVAWKIVTGDIGQIDLKSLYACEAATSMVGSLGGAPRAMRGDATGDPMLVIMRGMAMLLKGYFVAHPFDETVTETFAGLQAELVSAVQQGVQVAEAWKIMVDPYFQELGRKWREVTRLAGARPVLGLVAKEVLATAAVKALREHAASCTPVVQVSAADVRKLRSDLEASKAAVAELTKKLATKGGAPSAGGGVTQGMAAWKADKGNAGKCYFWTLHSSCKFGSQCTNSAQPGHPQ